MLGFSTDHENFAQVLTLSEVLKFVIVYLGIDLFKEVWDGALLFWKMADTWESSPRCSTGVAVGKVVNILWNLTPVIWCMKDQRGFSMKTDTCLSHERNV